MEENSSKDTDDTLKSDENGHTSSGALEAPHIPKSVSTQSDLGGEEKKARFYIEKVQSPTRPISDHEMHQSTVHDFETIGYATHEALPLTVFYRNESSVAPGTKKSRPTLAELHKGFDELDDDNEKPLIEKNFDDHRQHRHQADSEANVSNSQSTKFGWIKGVLIPCLLNIWGVILYLRLPWLTGQAGILLVTCIILLSAIVTTITTMSMSAICTNGQVKGGGAYYLISRSLGPAFGGSIGIIFSLANAVGVALYVVGFSETTQELFERANFVMVDKVNDIRIIGIIIVIILLGITLVGMSWVIRTQIFLLFILVLSMLDYAIGTFTGSLLTDSAVLKAQGFTSHQLKTFKDNLFPLFRGETFFTTFSIFFPAATGILAGVNISGDLKDPQKAVPKGTFAAILLTTIVYILLAWLIGGSSVRDAMGVVAAVNNQTLANATKTVVANATACIPNCKYGLVNDYQLMERVSLVGPLVLAGIFAATLSSALASLVGSPKTFQAVCRDKIFDGLQFFGKGNGPNDEPRRAYVLTFLISTAFILIGQLDLIAPVISNFFLMSYALINYSVFAASLGRSPGWRPSFKFYNMWLSLLGCFICVGIMFLINWWAALITIVIVMSLHKYVGYKKPKINWGSSGQAHTYIKALKLAHQLNKTDHHVKNFRPQCLVLSGVASSRTNLIHFVSNLTKHVGLMICGQVVIKSSGTPDEAMTRKEEQWLQENRIKSFVSVTAAPNVRQGAQALMQCCGLGKLKPNIVVLGYKHDWLTADTEKVNDYINIIHDAFEAQLSVAILRTPKGTVIEDDEYDDFDEELDLELAGAFRITNGRMPPTMEFEENTDDCERCNNSTPNPLTRSVQALRKDEGSKGDLTGSNSSSRSLLALRKEEGSKGDLERNSNSSRTLLEPPKQGEENKVDAERSSNPRSSNPTPLATPLVRTGSARKRAGESAEEHENSSSNLAPMANLLSRSGTLFRKKTGEPKSKDQTIIDVWWLYDDGGLTILLPYLLSKNKLWKGCSLRILTPVGDSKKEKSIKANHVRMASLLKKFRIDVSGIEEVSGMNSKPKKESIDRFFDTKIKEEIPRTETLDKKTLRQIRLGELVREHSSQAKLVVLTMPVGRKTVVSNLLYMSWLHSITNGLDVPVLLVRGNQTSVLTFYS